MISDPSLLTIFFSGYLTNVLHARKAELGEVCTKPRPSYIHTHMHKQGVRFVDNLEYEKNNILLSMFKAGTSTHTRTHAYMHTCTLAHNTRNHTHTPHACCTST